MRFFYLYKVIIRATNLGTPTTIVWNGKTQETGIYKKPFKGYIELQEELVKNDTISNREVHGGIDKACYLFSSDHYSYWRKKYPDLDWNWGMFGENLTVDGLNEDEICIGDVFSLGSTVVQVSQPREPCFKLGIRFGSQQILKEFISYGYPGTYVRVLSEGRVSAGDSLILIKASENKLSVKQFFELLYAKKKDPKIVQLAINNAALPLKKREKLRRYL